MADYYTQVSFIIPAQGEEKQWLVDVFEGINGLHDGGDAPSCICSEVITVAADQGLMLEEAYPPEWSPEQDGIWVRSFESCDVELLAVIIQAYLRKFHPNSFLGFEWADSCSKLRLESFGGGAVYIDAHDIRFMSTRKWLRDRFKEAAEGGGGLVEVPEAEYHE